jgi:hypothetical protein
VRFITRRPQHTLNDSNAFASGMDARAQIALQDLLSVRAHADVRTAGHGARCSRA